MASTVPIAGSAYTYAYATMGEFIAWMIGWDLILEYALGATTVAIGWSGYVVSFLRDLGIPISDQFATSPLAYDAAAGVWSRTGAVLNVPAMLIIVAISSLLVIGIRESSRVNNIIVVIKVAIVVAFIVAGIAFVSTQNWVTAGNPDGAFIPPNQAPGIFGWSGVLRGAAVVFFAYIGFDAVSTASQEAINPQRDMPIGILAWCLHAALRAGELCDHRHHALRQAERAGPDRRSRQRDRSHLAVAHHQAGRDIGPNLGHPRAADRPAAHLLFHVARRAAAALRRQDSSALPHALRQHHYRRHHRLDSGGAAANRACR